MKHVLACLAILVGVCPTSLIAQDFSGGFDKPKEYVQRDLVGYASYYAEFDHSERPYPDAKWKRLKPEYQHCYDCMAHILFWPDGAAYLTGNCRDIEFPLPSRHLDNRLDPPLSGTTYTSNASYTINGSRLTITIKKGPSAGTLTFHSFAHGKFKNDCGTVTFSEDQLKRLTGGTPLNSGWSPSPSYPTIRIIHD